MADPNISASTSQEEGAVIDPTDDRLSDFFTAKSIPLYLAAQALEYGCNEEDNLASFTNWSAEDTKFRSSLIGSDVPWHILFGRKWVNISKELTKASAAGLPTEKFQRKLDHLTQYNNEIQRMHRYIRDMEYELAKDDLSALRIDKRATEKTGLVHVTISSLDLWAQSKYEFSSFLTPIPKKGKGETSAGHPPSIRSKVRMVRRHNRVKLPEGVVQISVTPIGPVTDIDIKKYRLQLPQFREYLPSVTGEPQGLPPPDGKPWLIVDPHDPEPLQPWYTPARYFARQLIKDNSTLLKKRDLLASKVAQSLFDVGIKKRGGLKRLNPATVKKAFVKAVS